MVAELEVLSRALACFVQAKEAIQSTFGVESPSEIVAAVLEGVMQRNGYCRNGWEYFVHGVGYSVVVPSGGQVHFDGNAQGDVFTAYDVAFFMETAADFEDLDAATVTTLCEMMCASGSLRRVGKNSYSLPAS